MKTLNNVSLLGNGNITISQFATGTADGTTFLRGDGTWSVPLNLSNSNLTSSANTRTFTLNGATSANKLEISNGTNAVLHIAGNNTVWARGRGNITTNAAFGEEALDANTSGATNTAFGYRSLSTITTGNGCSAFGSSALFSNTGADNNAFGSAVLFNNTSGSRNNAFGSAVLLSMTSGSDNSAFGHRAGRFIADGATANTISNQSVFLGSLTKALADNQTNQIVIGHNAIGAGSNTVTIGNTSIVKTILRGTINAAGLPTSPVGLVSGDIWNNLGILTIV
jgi:hypothetical protein